MSRLLIEEYAEYLELKKDAAEMRSERADNGNQRFTYQGKCGSD